MNEAAMDAVRLELRTQELAAAQRGQRVRMNILYNGEELTVERISPTAEGIWRLLCVDHGGKGSIIICHPLAFPIRLSFHDKYEGDDRQGRKPGFQLDEEPGQGIAPAW